LPQMNYCRKRVNLKDSCLYNTHYKYLVGEIPNSFKGNKMAKTFTVRCSISMNPPLGDAVADKVFEKVTEKDVVHLERHLVNFIGKLTQIGEDIAAGKAVEPVKLAERTYVKVDFSVVDVASGNEWAGLSLRYPNLDRPSVDMINGMLDGQLSGVRDDVKKKQRKHHDH